VRPWALTARPSPPEAGRHARILLAGRPPSQSLLPLNSAAVRRLGRNPGPLAFLGRVDERPAPQLRSRGSGHPARLGRCRSSISSGRPALPVRPLAFELASGIPSQASRSASWTRWSNRPAEASSGGRSTRRESARGEEGCLTPWRPTTGFPRAPSTPELLVAARSVHRPPWPRSGSLSAPPSLRRQPGRRGPRSRGRD
jgi:hypothetical protein